ncbi:unnamed protein product [Closterium sp. NIES-54]
MYPLWTAQDSTGPVRHCRCSLLLPYLFPELSAFATVAEVVTHLRTTDARYHATVPAEFLATNQPPMFITLYFIVSRLPDSLRYVRDRFLSLDPTSFTLDLLEQHLLAAETSAVAVAAARGTPRPPFFEGCSPSPLSPSFASAVAADISVPEHVGAASTSAKRRSSKGKGGRGGGGGSSGGGGGSGSGGGGSNGGGGGSGGGGGGGVGGGSGSSGGVGGGSGGSGGSGGGGSGGGRSGSRRGGPGGEAAAQGASASGTPPGTAPAEALHTFKLDSGASRCFICDSTTLTPLPAPVLVRLADPSGGPVIARSSTVLPCPVVPSGSLSGLHLPSFSTNLVSTAALQDVMVTTTSPGGQHVSIWRCTRTGRHLATFTHRPGSTLYTLATEPSQVAASAQVSASGQVAACCSCRLLSHQTLLWHHRLGHPSLPCLRGMHSRFLVSVRLQLCKSFDTDLPVLRQHSDRGGEFSSDLLRDFCRGEGILQSFTLPDSPQQNGIAKRRIGLVMELNLSPHVSLPETSPTLRWTGKVGDASVFWVWGSRAFVRDTSANKLSARAIPCVFLGFVPDAPGWQFYHPTSRCILPSQDVTFDESVPFYRLFPYRSAPPPPPPLFLAPGPPPVDPLPPQGSCRLRCCSCAASGGAASRGAEPGGAGSEGAGAGGAEPGGAEPEGVEPGGAESEDAESRGAEPRGAALSGGTAGASPRVSSQQLREWLVWRAHHRSGAPGAGGAGDTGAGGAAVLAGAGGIGGAVATGPGGARTSGVGAARTGGVGCAGAGDPTEPGAAGAGGAGAVGAGVGGPGAGGAGAARAGVGGTGTGGAGPTGAGAVDPGAGGAGGTVRPRSYFIPLLQQILGVPSSTGLLPPFLCPPPDQSQPPLQPASPLPAPSPYTEQFGNLTERREPASRPVLPVRTARRAPRWRPPPVPGTHAMALRPSSVPDPVSDRARAASPTVSRLLATAVTDPSFESAAASALIAELLDFAAACRLDYATALVAESVSARPPFVGGECALGTDVLEDRQEDFECLAAAVLRFSSMLLAHKGDPDALDIPTPRSYAEAITGTYVNEVPLSRANIVDGMWIFRVKRPPGSPPAFKACYVARGFSQRQGVDCFQTFCPTPKMTTLQVLLHVAAQRDYKLHSLDFSPAFLQGSLHEEIWLRRPPSFTGMTTLAALGFAPSTADPSLFLRTDTSLPPFYVLVYVDDLVFATADTEALTLVKSELQKRHTCTDLGELRSYLGLQITRDRARRTITVTHSSCDAEIYARAMAAQELRWLTYLLTDLGEQPRSPPVLYVNNKAMIALCQEHRLEHRTKHIALRYFLAQELQQHGQLCLAYVATWANTADVFTKALPLAPILFLVAATSPFESPGGSALPSAGWRPPLPRCRPLGRPPLPPFPVAWTQDASGSRAPASAWPLHPSLSPRILASALHPPLGLLWHQEEIPLPGLAPWLTVLPISRTLGRRPCLVWVTPRSTQIHEPHDVPPALSMPLGAVRARCTGTDWDDSV